MYTIKRMTMKDHSDTSWEALFDCEDDERRNYKIMYGATLVDQELTFSEAKEMKAYYESLSSSWKLTITKNSEASGLRNRKH